jgi:hypothetical protein
MLIFPKIKIRIFCAGDTLYLTFYVCMEDALKRVGKSHVSLREGIRAAVSGGFDTASTES